MIKMYGKKLTELQIKTAGISLDKSDVLLCSGAEKRKPYTRSKIVLHVLIGQRILTLHVNEISPEMEERYKRLRKQLREQDIVPVKVPNVMISAYSHETLHGLKLSCDSFQLIGDKEKKKDEEKPCEEYTSDDTNDFMIDFE